MRTPLSSVLKTFAFFLAFLILPVVAFAAPPGGVDLPKDLSILWVLPFVCLLLCIAILPLVKEHFWHHHYGKVAVFWALAFLVPCYLVYGLDITIYYIVHALVGEYIPFILLLFALFTVAGGIRLKGALVGTPVVNTGILAIGTCLASLMGTTGAAMILIRPLLRANAHRKFRVHQVVFFIFLVANIGGSLTPLGDPPLFLGFLKGVSFFWTAEYLFEMAALASVALLAIFFIFDTVLYMREDKAVKADANDKAKASTEKLGFEGQINFIFLLCVISAVLFSGYVKIGTVSVYGTYVAIESLIRDVALIVIALLSLKYTDKACREANGFEWEPILEVAKLFIGIFLSMIPALYILNQGMEGSLAGVVSLVNNSDGTANNLMYFWITGILSSMLDNAPTYLVFFNTAGGGLADIAGVTGVEYLMTTGSKTLQAISAGAVFCGAMTYIGNAPNFMVRAIANRADVKMPSFFGYIAWSAIILGPVFIVISLMNF